MSVHEILSKQLESTINHSRSLNSRYKVLFVKYLLSCRETSSVSRPAEEKELICFRSITSRLSPDLSAHFHTDTNSKLFIIDIFTLRSREEFVRASVREKELQQKHDVILLYIKNHVLNVKLYVASSSPTAVSVSLLLWGLSSVLNVCKSLWIKASNK